MVVAFGCLIGSVHYASGLDPCWNDLGSSLASAVPSSAVSCPACALGPCFVEHLLVTCFLVRYSVAVGYFGSEHKTVYLIEPSLLHY